MTFFVSNLSEERLIKLWERQQTLWLGCSALTFVSGFSLLALRHLTLHQGSKITDIFKWLVTQAVGVCGLVWWLQEEEIRRYEHKFSLFRAAFGTPPGLKPAKGAIMPMGVSVAAPTGLAGSSLHPSPVLGPVVAGGGGPTGGLGGAAGGRAPPAIRINPDVERLKHQYGNARGTRWGGTAGVEHHHVGVSSSWSTIEANELESHFHDAHSSEGDHSGRASPSGAGGGFHSGYHTPEEGSFVDLATVMAENPQLRSAAAAATLGPHSSPALRFKSLGLSDSFVDAVETPARLEEELSDFMLAASHRTRPRRDDVDSEAFHAVAMPAFSGGGRQL